MFSRRAKKGQCFQQPYLGAREFPASFKLLEENESLTSILPTEELNKDFGWMLHDIDFNDDKTPRFFRAKMADGVVKVPPLFSSEVIV